MPSNNILQVWPRRYTTASSPHQGSASEHAFLRSKLQCTLPSQPSRATAPAWLPTTKSRSGSTQAALFSSRFQPSRMIHGGKLQVSHSSHHITVHPCECQHDDHIGCGVSRSRACRERRNLLRSLDSERIVSVSVCQRTPHILQQAKSHKLSFVLVQRTLEVPDLFIGAQQPPQHLGPVDKEQHLPTTPRRAPSEMPS